MGVLIVPVRLGESVKLDLAPLKEELGISEAGEGAGAGVVVKPPFVELVQRLVLLGVDRLEE